MGPRFVMPLRMRCTAFIISPGPAYRCTRPAPRHRARPPSIRTYLMGLGLPPLAGQDGGKEGGQGEARAIGYDVAAVAPAACTKTPPASHSSPGGRLLLAPVAS
eukprot:scaffold123510_cov69-Phaeocystis_antarctica.AAC.1